VLEPVTRQEWVAALGLARRAWPEGERCGGWWVCGDGSCLGSRKKKGGQVGLMGQKGQLG
jgi:hypothetical protein